MEKIIFQTDDAEVIAFLYSLGRSRSVVLNQLIKDCIEDGGGYVSPRIMAETGFSYKNKKPVIPTSERKQMYLQLSSQKKNDNKNKVTKRVSKPNSDQVNTRKQKESVSYKTPVPEKEVKQSNETNTVGIITPVTEPEVNKSSGPIVSNPALVMAGMSVFGI